MISKNLHVRRFYKKVLNVEVLFFSEMSRRQIFKKLIQMSLNELITLKGKIM